MLPTFSNRLKRFDFVIIGGGIAGITCCEQLYQLLSPFNSEYKNTSKSRTIALICAHPLLRGVSKMTNISQYLMDIEVEEYSHQQFLLKMEKNSNENERNRLSIIQGFVTHLNPNTNVIKYQTFDNENTNLKSCENTISFVKVLIASGSSPNVFLMNGKKHPLIHVLRDTQTIADFQQKVLQSSSSLMIVGNGGIALEMIHTLHAMKQKKMDLIWIIKHSFIGNTFFDQTSAAFLLPFLFPEKDPNPTEIGNGRQSNINEYGNIAKCQFNDNQTADVIGSAVGPRWIAQLTHVQNEHQIKPLWMAHTEIYNKNEKELPEHTNTEVCKEERKEDNIMNDIRLQMNCDISQIKECFSENGNKLQLKVLLTNGESFVVDHILCAIGTTPNTEFCEEFEKNELENNGSLIVNQFMQCTNYSHIYAAGDCCWLKFNNIEENINRNWSQMKLWTQAQNMGFIAAHSMMCETDEECENNLRLQFNFELFAHVTQFVGKKCVFLGKYNICNEDDEEDIRILLRVKPCEEYVKFVIKNGRLIGAVIIGETDLEETAENLILNQIDLSMYTNDEELLMSGVDLEAMFD